MKIEKELPQIQKNILLRDYTTFRIGGKAKYFFGAKTKKDIISAIKTSKKFKLPFFIFGEGSNLLVSDEGFNGLVIKIQNTKYKIRDAKIIAGAGAMLGELVEASVKAGLPGLEWAAGIPGTVGGAIWGNAGACGKSMKDVIQRVEVFDVKTEKVKILKNKDCELGYRDSVFKRKKNLIVLSAVFQLKREEKKIKDDVEKNLEDRKKRQPLNFPSAGSVFKNPEGFFAGELIEKCGLKGKKIGNAKISEKHANFIINLGKAKAKDVKKLINLAKKKVKNKFGITLEEEIVILN